jgi:hypothetical protein
MTAVTGANLRTGEAYWELSGPLPINRMTTCRACKESILKNTPVMIRDGRKLRFFYHAVCFTGDAGRMNEVVSCRRLSLLVPDLLCVACILCL